MPRQRLLRIGGRAALSVQLTVAAFSLAGIGFFLWIYFAQNNLAVEVFEELSLQEENQKQLNPVELVDLSHKACVLDTGIQNVESFLQPVGDTLSSGGWCGNYVRVFIIFASEAGYPAHKFHIQSGGRSHTLAEVYYQGKWRIIDPFFNQVYLLPDGELATYQDLRQDLSLLDAPERGAISNPDLERIYRGYEPVFPRLYRDAPDFYLRVDPRALYHNIFVGLSYPLDPFYEGVRRPILPSWLDRPELLGTYALAMLFLVTVTPLSIRYVKNRDKVR